MNNNLKYPIVAVDWDNTLYVPHKYARGLDPKGSSYLKQYRDLGGKLILFTCRAGKIIDTIVDICKMDGLEFDAINENIPEQVEAWLSMHPNDEISPKPFWYMLIDDTSFGMQNGIPWDDIGKEILKYKEE